MLKWHPSLGATGYKIFYDDDARNPPFDPAQDGSPTLANCILWGDTPDEICLTDTGADTPVISYCNMEGSWPGPGNIQLDPLFVDADGQLLAGSPCIDAGHNATVPADVTTDLDGNPRFADDPRIPDTGNDTPPIVDMAAYEFGSAAPSGLYE